MKTPKAAQLIIVRDCETGYGNGVLLGRSDVALNTCGVRQAKELAIYLKTRHLRGRKIFALYSSPLRRAQQVAAIIAKPFKQEVTVVQELNERDVGKLEGLTWEEARAKYGKRLPPLPIEPFNYRRFGGESDVVANDRLRAIIGYARNFCGGKVVVFVTHCQTAALTLHLLGSKDVQYEEHGHWCSFLLRDRRDSPHKKAATALK